VKEIILSQCKTHLPRALAERLDAFPCP
jgi:hypothetical protein